MVLPTINLHWDSFVPVFSHVFLKIVLFKAPQLDGSPSLIFVQVFSDVFPIQRHISNGFSDMFLDVSHIFMRISQDFPWISHGFPHLFDAFPSHHQGRRFARLRVLHREVHGDAAAQRGTAQDHGTLLQVLRPEGQEMFTSGKGSRRLPMVTW